MTTSVAVQSIFRAFNWEPQPRAAELVSDLVDGFLVQNALARVLRDRLLAEAGVRFVDLVDHVVMPTSPALADRLLDVGFTPDVTAATAGWHTHPGGVFPAVVLNDSPTLSLAIKVESVVEFLSTWQLGAGPRIQGEPLAPLRQVIASAEPRAELQIVERHGWRGMSAPEWSAKQTVLALKHAEAFRLRRREFEPDDEDQGYEIAHKLIAASIADLGVDYTCDLFFAAEREFWQRRNRAGHIQKTRQDRLGIGWANHDHHTYRSSRQHFAAMIGVFEHMGFHCRERFYAGAQAGWGAQVLEQPTAGITIFADVDLSPQELFEDFSHQGLAPRHDLGTVGLWCALHGEAFLQAGMHHLECQFGFHALKEQLEGQEQIKVMKPFTDFSYLRQAFTEGERWPVCDSRIDRLEKSGQITRQQAESFRANGAVGSHLENLERNDGFKGFNQTGVSEIIAKTDPRKMQAE